MRGAKRRILARERGTPFEHRLGVVEADGGARLHALVHHPGQFACPTAEVDRAAAGERLDEIEEVVEGLASLVVEAIVLFGVPGAGRHRWASCAAIRAAAEALSLLYGRDPRLPRGPLGSETTRAGYAIGPATM